MKKFLLILALLMVVSVVFVFLNNDPTKTAINEYMKTTYVVKSDGWKIKEVYTENNTYYADLTLGTADKQSVELLYGLAKLSAAQNGYAAYDEAVSNLENNYRQRLKEQCPQFDTEAGKLFWDSVEIDSFFISSLIESQSIGYVSAFCERAPEKQKQTADNM